jgi:hypothetical protein
MAAVYCQAALCYGQRIALDGARPEAVNSASCDLIIAGKKPQQFNWFNRF